MGEDGDDQKKSGENRLGTQKKKGDTIDKKRERKCKHKERDLGGTSNIYQLELH